jgi:hypothetical protein
MSAENAYVSGDEDAVAVAVSGDEDAVSGDEDAVSGDEDAVSGVGVGEELIGRILGRSL